MVGATAGLVALYSNRASSQDTLKYIIPNAFTGLFAIIYLIKYKFAAKVFERLLQIVQDGLIITTLNIFFFKYDWITMHHIDFYALVVVMVIEVLLTFIKFIMFCRNKGD